MGLLTEEGWFYIHPQSQPLPKQSKVLLSEVQDLIKASGKTLGAIDEVAVGEGPGSYTGLRMGITVAKTWAFAKGVPLYCFSSTKIRKDPSKSKVEQAEDLDLRLLDLQDFRRVRIENLVPIYERDHFAEPSGERAQPK